MRSQCQVALDPNLMNVWWEKVAILSPLPVNSRNTAGTTNISEVYPLITVTFKRPSTTLQKPVTLYTLPIKPWHANCFSTFQFYHGGCFFVPLWTFMAVGVTDKDSIIWNRNITFLLIKMQDTVFFGSNTKTQGMLCNQKWTNILKSCQPATPTPSWPYISDISFNVIIGSCNGRAQDFTARSNGPKYIRMFVNLVFKD